MSLILKNSMIKLLKNFQNHSLTILWKNMNKKSTEISDQSLNQSSFKTVSVSTYLMWKWKQLFKSQTYSFTNQSYLKDHVWNKPIYHFRKKNKGTFSKKETALIHLIAKWMIWFLMFALIKNQRKSNFFKKEDNLTWTCLKKGRQTFCHRIERLTEINCLLRIKKI